MMKKQYFILLILAGLLTLLPACRNNRKFRTLIITGQGDHDWQASSPALKEILNQTGMFSARIIVTPEKGEDISDFNPDFTRYRLVVLDYNGDSWSEETKTAFIEYVRNGGGVVVYSEAGNAFPGWKEYNYMIGLGGGEARDENNGPYVYFRRNEMVIDTSAGTAGSHGERYEFEIRTRITDHPITSGLPVRWLHGSDILSNRLRGPAIKMDILATAFANPKYGGSGRDEPVLMTISYEKGRIFHTTLGYPYEDSGPAMQCPGFISTFRRGAEWAVTGNVTQPVPRDFPSAAAVVIRDDFREISISEAMENLADYNISKSTKYFTTLQSYIRQAGGDEKTLLKYEKMMVKVLVNDETTVEAKKLLLRELSWMGSDYCISAIEDLAENNELKDEAEFALERLKAE